MQFIINKSIICAQYLRIAIRRIFNNHVSEKSSPIHPSLRYEFIKRYRGSDPSKSEGRGSCQRGDTIY